MRILVLGGTQFVGRHIVASARSVDHDVTVFHRGKTNPQLFPRAEHRVGDRRTGDLDSLRHGEWDVVIDSSAYVPRIAREAAELLSGRVGLYVFVSTVSAYSNFDQYGLDETASVLEPADPATELADDESYGAMKVACEAEVRRVFASNHLVIRAGAMAGPFDNTDRFTYWVRRMARGGPVLAPPRPDQPVQLMHARDHADFVLRLAAQSATGVFNVVGPPTTYAGMLGACAEVAGLEHDVVWATQEWLDANEITFPFQLRESIRGDGVFAVSGARALAAGLMTRSLADTARTVFEWDSRRGPKPLAFDLSAEDERRLLEELSASRRSVPAAPRRTRASPLGLDLPVRDVRPRTSCVIATTPRTGSWMLADLLAGTGLVGQPQEYFREDIVRTLSGKLGLDASGEITPDYLNGIFGSTSTATGIWSTKLQPYDLTRLIRSTRSRSDELMAASTDADAVARLLPDPRYVYLRRKDSARQAMSWYRALVSKVWWEYTGESRQAPRPGYPDFLQVHWLENQIAQHEADWMAFFRSGGVETLEVVYEDMVEDPAAVVQGVFDFLSLSFPAGFAVPTTKLERMADSDTDAWVRAYDVVRDSLPPMPEGWSWSLEDDAFVAPA